LAKRFLNLNVPYKRHDIFAKDLDDFDVAMRLLIMMIVPSDNHARESTNEYNERGTIIAALPIAESFAAVIAIMRHRHECDYIKSN